MAYDKCVGYEGFECPEVKTGQQRRTARCRSCANNAHSLKMTGRTAHNKGKPSSLKGKPLSPATIEKLRAAAIGNTNGAGTPSIATRRAISIALGGDGDVENRRYPGWARWTYLVKERDGRCTMCGTVENLEAHHIIPKAVRPDLCAVLENGLTLCAGCHRTEPWAIHKTSFNSFS